MVYVKIKDKGELFTWGRFLVNTDAKTNANKKPTKKSKKNEKKLADAKVMNKFPAQTGQYDRTFKEVVTGSNHTAGISNDNKIYIWGWNSIQNRLGFRDPADNEEAKEIPMEPKALLDVLQEAKDEKRGEALGSESDERENQDY